MIEKLKAEYPYNFRSHYHPHSFWHAKATHLYNNGLALLIIKDFLKHSSVETTKIYAIPDSKKISEQIIEANKNIVFHPKFPRTKRMI